jgi:Cft2 family RNA processing exonuclease
LFHYHQDLCVSPLKLWLDPARGRRFAFISHAHGDHIARHQRTLATPQTFALCEHRFGGPMPGTRLDYGASLEIADGKVSLLRAGHMLGSAQILIEHGGERLVYTGDFNPRGDGPAGACDIVPCDTLIMECTYGDPAFRFPPRKETLDALADCVRELLAAGRTPVLLAHLYARAPELTRELSGRGFTVAVPPSVVAVLELYRRLDVDVGRFELLSTEQLEGRVVILPPHLHRSRLLKSLPGAVRVAVTGYAAGGAQAIPYEAERGFAISDHADFDGLVRYVQGASPRTVYVTHGPDSFCQTLREHGFAAYPLAAKVRA